MLRNEIQDLCVPPEERPLPPFRDVNHSIPIIDESKVYRWRPSRCPEPLRYLWNQKRDAYIKTKRWQFAAGRNAVTMMIVPEKSGPQGEPRARTVLDKRDENENTIKFAAPFPHIETIVTNVLAHPHRTGLDIGDAFEQMRVIPE